MITYFRRLKRLSGNAEPRFGHRVQPMTSWQGWVRINAHHEKAVGKEPRVKKKQKTSGPGWSDLNAPELMRVVHLFIQSGL